MHLLGMDAPDYPLTMNAMFNPKPALGENLSFEGQGAAFYYVEPPLLVDGFE